MYNCLFFDHWFYESVIRYDTVVFIFFQDNKLNGPAMIFAANGDRIELSYENGVVNGKATIKGMSLKCFSSRYMFNTLWELQSELPQLWYMFRFKRW